MERECLESLSKIQLIDDNSSFFSHNAFQKIMPDQDSSSYSTDSSSVTPHSNILNDNLPDINSSEDWEAAFGFSNKKSESPLEQTESNRNSIVSENGLNNFGSQQQSDNYVKIEQPYLDYSKTQNYDKSRDLLEVLNRPSQYSLKMEQNDIIVNTNTTPYVSITCSLNQKDTNINNLDHQMSKFFAEFNKNNQSKELSYNGFNSNGYVQNERQQQQAFISDDHNLLVLNQYQQRLDRQLQEEQAMFNLKQSILLRERQAAQVQAQFAVAAGQQPPQQPHAHSPYVTNGGDHAYLTQNGQPYGNGTAFTQNTVFQVSISQSVK